MADNLGYTPGTGATVATDEVAGAHYQLVKPAFGSDGQAQAVSPDNPLPVEDANTGSLLWRILQVLMSPLGYDKALQRQRGTVLIESGTVTTVTTVTNLSSLNGIGGYSAQIQVLGQNLTAWHAVVRSRIS